NLATRYELADGCGARSLPSAIAAISVFAPEHGTVPVPGEEATGRPWRAERIQHSRAPADLDAGWGHAGTRLAPQRRDRESGGGTGGGMRGGQGDTAAFQVQPDREAGAARLPVVVLVSLINMFFAAVLEYALPLYFNALEGFPKRMWADLAAWLVAPWALAPLLAGLLARRFSERRVWGAAMLGQAAVPALFAAIPEPWIVAPAACWYGFMNALVWIGGISLTQVVPANRKGLANGLVMMSLGLGSFVGPLAGRAILWRHRVGALVEEGS